VVDEHAFQIIRHGCHEQYPPWFDPNPGQPIVLLQLRACQSRRFQVRDEVGSSLPENLGVVVAVTDNHVAAIAKQGSNSPGQVVMVY
jgi:hypothetical protein